jgi:hypothetical protein
LTLYKADGSSEDVKVSEIDGFQAELGAFAAACESGSAPQECRPEESAEAIRMTLAMRESRERSGAPVTLD